MTPKEIGETIEKAFEGKLPESLTEKLVRKGKKEVLNQILKFLQKESNFAIDHAYWCKRNGEKLDAEFYDGEQIGLRIVEQYINTIKEKLS